VKTFLFFTSAVVMLIISSASLEAGERTPARSKVIDFEGELVEGMNKKPLDALNQISEAERRRRRPHLYRLRKGYRTESHESLSELRSMEGMHQ